MSNEFESLVRPFESEQTTPSQTYYPAGQAGAPNVKLQIGRNGSGKVLNGSYSETQSFYCAQHQTEKPKDTSAGEEPSSRGRARVGGEPGKSGREKHIVRIKGESKGGPTNDVWVDVERRDRFTMMMQNTKGQAQETEVTLKWNDEPGQDPEAPGRETDEIRVCSSEERDPEDPESWVDIKVIKSLTFVENGTYMTQTFKVSGDNARGIETRKISHSDTNIDKAALDFFKASSNNKGYVVDGKDYKKIVTETQDSGNAVEVEVIKTVQTRATHRSGTGAGADQAVQMNMKNKQLLDQSTPGVGKKGAEGYNPPWRLDPFQNIVNCNFLVYADTCVVADVSGVVGVTKNGHDWTNVSGLDFGANGDIGYGKYFHGREYFYLDGDKYAPGEPGNALPVAMKSQDGVYWFSDAVGQSDDTEPKVKYCMTVNGYEFRVKETTVERKKIGTEAWELAWTSPGKYLYLEHDELNNAFNAFRTPVVINGNRGPCVIVFYNIKDVGEPGDPSEMQSRVGISYDGHAWEASVFQFPAIIRMADMALVKK